MNGAVNWMPPSVVALGTFASAERKSELWFGPAGYTRASLTNGSAGLPVLAAKERLTREQRDELYAANINPVATFTTEGIVIFGQKTLQVTKSALDRISVRRLMIFVKKRISRIAATTLFQPNVKQTWANFTTKVIPFLDNIKTRLGLTDYKVVLDETTTTPDLIDRNIMYAKIFLKPARAIEFIAIDFVITNTGAAFED
jgi:phage tail sheath protein FI